MSQHAVHLLAGLIDLAARSGRADLAVGVDSVGPFMTNSANCHPLAALIEELEQKCLLEAVGRGTYLVAAGLWTIGVWNPYDADYFPILD